MSFVLFAHLRRCLRYQLLRHLSVCLLLELDRRPAAARCLTGLPHRQVLLLMGTEAAAAAPEAPSA